MIYSTWRRWLLEKRTEQWGTYILGQSSFISLAVLHTQCEEVKDRTQNTQLIFVESVIQDSDRYRCNIIFSAVFTIFTILFPCFAGMFAVGMGNQNQGLSQIRQQNFSSCQSLAAVQCAADPRPKQQPSAASQCQCSRLQVQVLSRFPRPPRIGPQFPAVSCPGCSPSPLQRLPSSVTGNRLQRLPASGRLFRLPN